MTISSGVLSDRLPIVGNVKIGGLRPAAKEGKRPPPVKFDHFRIVKLTRDAGGNFELDEAVHAVVGQKPTELDVHLPFDTMGENLYAQMVHYQGRTVQTHRCDGVTCRDPRTDATRPCDKAAGRDCPCKPYARLAVMLDAAPSYGGLYVYRTTSWPAVAGFQTFLRQLQDGLRVPLRALPLRLRLVPGEVTYRDGTATKIGTAYRVALELRASREEALQAAVEYHESTQIARSKILQLAAGAAEELAEADAVEPIGSEYFPDSDPETDTGVEVGGPGTETPSKLGEVNRQIIDQRIDTLRGLMARAETAGLDITAQVDRLEFVIASRDAERLTASIEWFERQLAKGGQ